MNTRTIVCEVQLQQALTKSELADVQLKIDDVWVASGHRSVLSAESPVFAMMCAHRSREEESGKIELEEGVTADGVLAFLEFLYLGTAFLPKHTSQMEMN